MNASQPSAESVSDAAHPRKHSGRMIVLVAALVVAAVAYFATAPMRRQAMNRAALLRHEVEEGEKRAKEEIESREKRAERVKQLEALADKPTDVPLLLKVGALYAQDQRYEDARFFLEEARRLDPKNAEPYRALYQTYVSQGRFDRAYDYADAGLKLAPGDLELVLGLVHIDSLVGWNSQARAALKSLKPDDANQPRALIASALIYRQVTDARHAEADLRKALQQEPKNDKIHALLSGVLWEIGRGKDAETAIRGALSLDPRNADYLLHLGEIQLARRTPEGIRAARDSAEAALRADPGNRNAFFALAQTFLAEKRRDEAEEILRKLLQRYPDHPHANFELARLCMASGRTEEGKRLLEGYQRGIRLADELKGLTLKVAMMTKSAPLHAELGELYNRTGSSDKAVLVLRRALQLDPKSMMAQRELARALQATNRAGEFRELRRRPEWHVIDPFAETI